MRKVLFAFVTLVLVPHVVLAAAFSPTLLKISADPVIQYDFDGSELNIPVTVSGTPAGVFFLVFSRGKADAISNVQNGYIGWHYVNNIDTCIYYSSLQSMSIGANTISWDGKDQDGGTLAAGDYTYYIYGYDNQSSKLKMAQYINYDRMAKIQEKDEDGLPFANPFWYTYDKRWEIGNDPMDESLIETTTVNLAEGWSLWGRPEVAQNDFNTFYIGIYNKDAAVGSLHKMAWVPGGDAELQTDFGEDGFAESFAAHYFVGSGSSGVTIDGDYLYTSSRCGTCTDPDADFYAFDMEGNLIERIDLTEWWSSLSDYEAGGQMNGGPSYFTYRDGYIAMNHYGCCLHQMVNPSAYLESGEMDDFWVWTNGNGDYTLDHNFEETAERPWVCNDFNVGPYIYTLATDANHFSAGNAYDAGAVSFGLIAPDGTGLGYLTYAGDTAGWKKSTLVIDADTPFDGYYCDNQQAGGTHYEGWEANEYTDGLYFIGQDSISGLLTNAVAVKDDAPEAFSVSQNAPNPFNPTTTIQFTLAAAGEVSVDVFNVAGQKVDSLASGFMNAGSHSVVWDASGFSGGVYFYRIECEGFSKTMKMTLLK